MWYPKLFKQSIGLKLHGDVPVAVKFRNINIKEII